MLNADKHVLNLFSLFVFSLCHTSTLSHHTSKPFSFSLYIQTHNFNSCGPNLAFLPKLIETTWNIQNSPELAEIWSEVEQGGQLFEFICQYEIFWSFQPEWNEINNNKLNYSSTSNCLQFNYWLRAGLEEIKLQLLP